jgi:transcriptional regulator with XRE-family HTH domain
MNVPEKIARLVAEKGWNQDVFADKAGIARTTARGILTHPERELRNATLRRCADALGLTVHELISLPVERLLPRVRQPASVHPGQIPVQELANQPALREWMARNPDRAARLAPQEIDELISVQNVGGPLTYHGVEHFVSILERKRELLRRVEILAGTEYLDLLEGLVRLMYDRITSLHG